MRQAIEHRNRGAFLKLGVVSSAGIMLPSLFSHAQTRMRSINMKPQKLVLTILLYCSPFIAICQNTFLKAKPITGASDAYPMFSSDGKKIVFHSDKNGPSDIYIMNADGSGVKQLTFNNANDNSPVWSPDGRKIVFASERDSGNSEIYIMNADGSEQKRLTNHFGDDSHPKFYDNGRRIVFNSERTTKDTSLDWSHRSHEIFTMNIEGSDVRQLTSFNTVCTYPSVSPDGKKLLFRRVTLDPGFNWDLTTAKRNSEVFVMNMDGTNVINLSSNSAYDGWPCWTPDGKIIFTSNRGGVPFKGQLYMISADGTELKQLTDKENSYIQASVSADGKTIICQHDFEGNDFDYGGVAIITLVE